MRAKFKYETTYKIKKKALEKRDTPNIAKILVKIQQQI